MDISQFLEKVAYADLSFGPLTKLLMPETITVRGIRHIAVGSYLQLPNGQIRRVTSIRRAHPDDWFADEEWVLTLLKPYVPDPFGSEWWLEDTLMPRVA